ncbi:UNVERIFIED_CONTAM: hypothetical protein GTU68_027100 [Idotea baltica]|nr:hypothetical protein [Idotea baltica]
MNNVKKIPISEKNEFELLIKRQLELVGEDPTREALLNTPRRVRESFEYLTSGYNESAEEIIKSALFKSSNQNIVLVKDIEFHSLCEHHLLPFSGVCHVAYIPSGKVVGLSKVARVVDVFSKRLQIQERLVEDIANAINDNVNPKGVAVQIKASHMCMQIRGVKKTNSTLVAQAFKGLFEESNDSKNEFYRLLD